ncbi:hypothetical protein [Micromonospora sagamiensis]|uniref:Uncharacterized protein n=1 Tax=Micromonospora sagamiensis TaxID=47875 RepID=A0A562WF83_9ACTN|nr:hypothetical protein [Micromonospora sagamiensis]TWJ28721.1 hypothetical protein JD81_02226 [Micromonospora sagamiensis]BCL12372.1 hypothetical protein GCM10017556_01110 [Micromonospora sagamiensis]
MAVNFDSLITELGTRSSLTVESSDELVDYVDAAAQKLGEKSEAFAYRKKLLPVRPPLPLTTTPAEVLHELGMATTFLGASPLAQVARHWAQVRYCTTLTTLRHGGLALSHVTEDVVYHHKVTQSEQLGIGLALVVAKAVLRDTHPGWQFRPVDAEVALKTGFIKDVGAVKSRDDTKKRPDYFLVGHRTRGRRSQFKVYVLECKGTHDTIAFTHRQLAKASLQVEALTVGGIVPPSLMVASRLTKQGITSYVLDPPGEDELWSGSNRDMDELLSAIPDEPSWRARRAVPPQSPGTAPPTSASGGSGQGGGNVAPGAPRVFDVPEERRGWFTQVLTRAAAAATLLFAGDSATARHYTTPRQRGDASDALLDADATWTQSTAMSLPLPNGLRLEGTRFRTPLRDGMVLEVYRGVEKRLYGYLAEGQVGKYLRAAPRVHERWHGRQIPGAVLSVGRDGTVLVARITNETRHRWRRVHEPY